MSDTSMASQAAPQSADMSSNPSLESSESDNNSQMQAGQEGSVENLQDLAQNGTPAQQKEAKKNAQEP